MKPASIIAAVILSCSALLPVVRAQDATEPMPEEEAVGGLPFAGEVEVTVVDVNVYVTNKQGFAVTDLEAGDFKLTQDGVEKPITNFGLFTEEIYRQFFQPETPPVVGAPTPVPVPDDVTRDDLRPVWVVLYFDNENSRSLERNRLIKQMSTFVRENLHPPVQMMVVTYQKSYEVLQPFTSDTRLINDALREVKTMVGGRNELDSSRRDILNRFAEFRRDSGSSNLNSANRAHNMMIGFAEEEANSLQFTIGALRDTLTMLSGLPGKKIIVYASNGLPMIAGLDLFYAYANAYNDPSSLTESTRYDMSRSFTTLVANANAQDVSIYTMGIGGLENPIMSSAEYGTPQDTMSSTLGMQNYLDSMRFMADNTGGTATINTNDFTEGLSKVAQDFYTYYSLGYTLHQSGLDKVHRIEVEIPDHPDYRVRYRRRFVEKSLESRVQDKVVTGLMFPLDENPMQIMVEIGAQAPASESRWVVPFQLSFPLRNIALLPVADEYAANVTLFIAARDMKGDRSDVVRQTHEIRVNAADYDEAQRQRFTISANLLMEVGSHNVAVGLLDPVTRQASFATTKVTVQE